MADNITRKDDRSAEDVARTVGFIVATDSYMSGWGHAPGRSIVAVPIMRGAESRHLYGYGIGFDAVDSRDLDRKLGNFERRPEFKRVRIAAGKQYRPRLRSGDHLHIYGVRSFTY